MKTKTVLLPLVGSVLAALLLALAACEKSPPAADSTAKFPATAPLVSAAERSKHFDAVNRQLELGGTMYGYVDIDGDVLKLANSLRTTLTSIPNLPPAAGVFLQQDFGKIGTTLGFTDVKALGLSSVPDAAGGFRNRIFLYTPDGRHGFLAGFGGTAGPFKFPQLAPADADFYSEGEFDLPVIYAAVKEVVAQIGGTTAVNAMEAALKIPAGDAGITGQQIIDSLKGRLVVLGKLDDKNTFTLPFPPQSPLVLPQISLLIRIDGIGAPLTGTLDKLPMLESSTVGTLKIYALKTELPVEGLRPVLAVEGGTLYLATTKEFLTECHDRKAGLDQDPAFQKALAAVGPEGNSLSYVSPQFVTRLKQLSSLNPKAVPEITQVLGAITRQLPDLKDPVVSVSANLPDGILIRSHSFRSLKQEVAMISIYNPITVGILAAMAIPAFEKVRASSQDKAITNNLRMLSTAADQYYLEHGVDTVTYAQLVGPEKEKYIHSIPSVTGEDYSHLRFRQGLALKVTTPDGRTISYGDDEGPSASAPEKPSRPVSAEVLAEVQVIRSSSTTYINAHPVVRTDLNRLASAATALGANPTPAQILALHTALDATIQRVENVGARGGETTAAKATAADLVARLKTLQATVAKALPSP